jgi:hypothetical protein
MSRYYEQNIDILTDDHGHKFQLFFFVLSINVVLYFILFLMFVSFFSLSSQHEIAQVQAMYDTCYKKAHIKHTDYFNAHSFHQNTS